MIELLHRDLRPVVRDALAAGFYLALGRKHVKLHAASGRLVAVLPYTNCKAGRHLAQTESRIRREIREEAA